MADILQNQFLQRFVTRWQDGYQKTGKLPCAYLLVSTDLLLTQGLAEKICETLLKKPQDSPDRIQIAPEKGSIKIESIRQLIHRTSLKPFQEERIIILISEADTLTEGAANALLKTLEEPPPDALFILTTSMEELLPVTIRSRCQKILLLAEPESLRETTQAALQNLSTEWSEFSQIPTASFAAASKFAESLAQETDKIYPFLQLLQWIWHDLVVFRETGDEGRLLLPENLPWLRRESTRRDSDRVFDDLDTILETERAIDGNVHKTLALERLFVKLMSS